MRYRWVIVVVALVGLAIVGRNATQELDSSPQTATSEASLEVTVAPTVDPSQAFDINAWDVDGDGAFSTEEIGPAAIAYADSVEFAPGYEFDPYRFGNAYRGMGYASWAVNSLAPVVVKAQTCSWVQYWLERTETGDSGEASRALRMLDDLRTDEALGDLSAPVGAMIAAAEIDDVQRVQEIFRGARCDLTFFVDDSIGPQGDRGYPRLKISDHPGASIIRGVRPGINHPQSGCRERLLRTASSP